MDQIFYNPIVNLFLFLYKSLGENFVLSIILVTFVFQLVLWPLTIKQYTATKKMKDTQEKLKTIQDKRSAGKELSVAEMQMASSAFKGMLAGCIPTLIQFPFLISIYNMFNKIASTQGDGTIFNNIVYSNALKFPTDYRFHIDFFGLDLSKTLLTVGTDNKVQLIIIVIIIGVTFAAQYYSMKLTTPQMGNNKKKEVLKIDATNNSEGKKKHKKPNQANSDIELKDPVDKQIAASPQQLQLFLTIFILFISIVSAAALSIYWCARSVFVIILTLIQRRYILKEK